MKVLAIDSSGLTATVAVVEDSLTIAEFTMNYKKTHSQTLLPMIDSMANMIELDLETIDAIAVAGGPGSFTGLRIGSATAKGLGLALNKPLIHIPTVDGLAYQVYGCEDLICPIMDARRSQVYTGLYTFAKNPEGGLTEPEFQIVEQQMAIAVSELIEKLNVYGKSVVFLGDGVPVYKNMLAEGLNVPYSFAPAYMNTQRASVVGTLGIACFKAGKYETAMEHQPDYLRVSQAERERAEREKNDAVIIRELKIEDAAAVAELEHQTYSDAWSEKGVMETIENPNTLCLAAEKSGKMIGYLLVYLAVDEAEIARITILKEVRRQGVASKLFEELGKYCKEHKMVKILLDVRENNTSARAFYEKHGFAVDGIRPEFYEKPKEDAVLMSCQL
ncbi:MAG: tRNA (adenosine(37)-N6)-threonylcarbamoyltransferase complex dimerization subunit type 1 TsaB [Schaedlerella sp.]|nr:tRNA (adenosine(37)-N6)-threonylcarbamoyltransferase complex dimerization subunit type 1 TsaB [Schaedlerella sp.]